MCFFIKTFFFFDCVQMQRFCPLISHENYSKSAGSAYSIYTKYLFPYYFQLQPNTRSLNSTRTSLKWAVLLFTTRKTVGLKVIGLVLKSGKWVANLVYIPLTKSLSTTVHITMFDFVFLLI